MRCALILACAIIGFSLVQAANAQSIPGERVGVVLMHGKWGTPKYLSTLAVSLRRAGVLVETPTMPWSRRRAYAKSYEDSMTEIDAAVDRLRRKGARRIFVGGHSMGANAALGYGARRDGLAGLILLAPGHVPGISGFAAKVAASVGKAKKLIARGKGKVRSVFWDLNQGRKKKVSATANVFLSWFDPGGPAVMSTNAANLKADIPVFCAHGTREPRRRCGYIERYLPKPTTTRSMAVKADHSGVVRAARQHILSWIRDLKAG